MPESHRAARRTGRPASTSRRAPILARALRLLPLALLLAATGCATSTKVVYVHHLEALVPQVAAPRSPAAVVAAPGHPLPRSGAPVDVVLP